ncbi:hypothetical protein LCGC14_0245830 [marine sediment metagenome]|uniref:Uncharacterized protein n=1 Tax=marine sediment metagenome TaxID=412755 RepID=A0A0F9UMF0_9ZZZZ
MKHLIIILLLICCSCKASILPVKYCTTPDSCPRPETTASMLTETTKWEGIMVTGVGGLLVVVFIEALIEANK